MIAKYVGKSNGKFVTGNTYDIDSRFSMNANNINNNIMYQPVIRVYYDNIEMVYDSPEDYLKSWVFEVDMDKYIEENKMTLKEFIVKYVNYAANIRLCVPVGIKRPGSFKIIKNINNETYGNSENILRGIGWQSKYANCRFVSIVSLYSPYSEDANLGIISVVLNSEDVYNTEKNGVYE